MAVPHKQALMTKGNCIPHDRPGVHITNGCLLGSSTIPLLQQDGDLEEMLTSGEARRVLTK